MNKLIQFWCNLRSSFWFMPLLIIAGSLVLAVVLVEADSAGSDRWPRLFGGGGEGACQMLSAQACSMITIMGITFSMTLLTLVQASSQYPSRILRNFMRNRITQFTLGVFAGIVHMEHGIGEFVVQNTPLVSIDQTYPPEQKTIDAINAAYSIGRHCTVDIGGAENAGNSVGVLRCKIRR